MIDMLFITDKKTMNFIVNYNMLKSPSQLAEEKKEKGKNQETGTKPNELKGTMQVLKKSICASCNRPIEDVSKIFPSYSVALNMLQGDFIDANELEQSKYVFN
jgi:hypothetical protein